MYLDQSHTAFLNTCCEKDSNHSIKYSPTCPIVHPLIPLPKCVPRTRPWSFLFNPPFLIFWYNQLAAMHFLHIPSFVTSLLFLPGLIHADTNISTFSGLLDSLAILGYHGKAATTFGALDHLTATYAPGAAGLCTIAVRFQEYLIILLMSDRTLTGR